MSALEGQKVNLDFEKEQMLRDNYNLREQVKSYQKSQQSREFPGNDNDFVMMNPS